MRQLVTDPIAAMGGSLAVGLRLVVAMLIGCILGLNRDLRHKPAGMRIHGLVSLGAALISVTSVQLAVAGTGQVDPGSVSRALQGIITGVGFLGGGVILRDESGIKVQGLTTAASIWVSACLGISVGVGHWETAIIALVLTLLLLVVGEPVERWVHGRIHSTESEPGRKP